MPVSEAFNTYIITQRGIVQPTSPSGDTISYIPHVHGKAADARLACWLMHLGLAAAVGLSSDCNPQLIITCSQLSLNQPS